MKKILTLEEFKAKLQKKAKKAAGGCFRLSGWKGSQVCVQSGECVTIKPPRDVFDAIVADMMNKKGKSV